MKIPSRDRIRGFLVRAEMAAVLALTKKNQKTKKANKNEKGNKTSEDFSPHQAPAGGPNQKYQKTGSITSDEDEPCLK
jgi:hypothetical protein